MQKMIEVGDYQKKEVTEENHEIYEKFSEIMNDSDNMGLGHMGYQGISACVDWLLSTYTITSKED